MNILRCYLLEMGLTRPFNFTPIDFAPTITFDVLNTLAIHYYFKASAHALMSLLGERGSEWMRMIAFFYYATSPISLPFNFQFL